MTYLLDANIFIQAKNLHYGFDFCPAFWDWLVLKNAEEIVWSIDKVADELKSGNDQLREWAISMPQMFRATNNEVVNKFGDVNRCLIGNYEDHAINKFMYSADYFLIAHAMVSDFIVVTHEKPKDSKAKIKIPNVCNCVGVRYMNPFQMLRNEHALFVLKNI